MSVDDFPYPRNLDRFERATGAFALPRVAAGVHLWWTALDRPREEVGVLARSLSSDEVTRSQRFGTEDLRLRWIVGRATLRQLLGNALGVAPSSVSLVRGRRGRPQLAAGLANEVASELADELTPASLDFNVSHTRGMALIGITAGTSTGFRIGVDVEHGERRVNADGLARKFLTEREQAALTSRLPDERRRQFLRLWTCKEAMSKATGDALAAPFRQLDVTVDDGLALVAGPAPYRPADWALHPIDMPDGFLGTVAIWHVGHTDSVSP